MRGKCAAAFRTFKSAHDGSSQPPYSIHRVFREDLGEDGKFDDAYLGTVVYANDTAKNIALRGLYAIEDEVEYSYTTPIYISDLVEGFATQPGKGSLAATESGNLILLSSGADPRLLKFRIDFGELIFDGWLDVGAPISRVEVGPEG